MWGFRFNTKGKVSGKGSLLAWTQVSQIYWCTFVLLPVREGILTWCEGHFYGLLSSFLQLTWLRRTRSDVHFFESWILSSWNTLKHSWMPVQKTETLFSKKKKDALFVAYSCSRNFSRLYIPLSRYPTKQPSQLKVYYKAKFQRKCTKITQIVRKHKVGDNISRFVAVAIL